MEHIRYPDGCITCTPQAANSTVVTDPVVIFEVLSNGSARRDRVEKSCEYRATASVLQYVMLEQGEIAATVMTRRGEDWIITLLGADDSLDLPSAGVALPLGVLYKDVNFSEAE